MEAKQLELNWYETEEDIYFNGMGEPLPWEEKLATKEYANRKLEILRKRWMLEVQKRTEIEEEARKLKLFLQPTPPGGSG